MISLRSRTAPVSISRRVATALPWACGVGAAAMTTLAARQWPRLSPADRLAYGLDAVAYTACVPLTARRHPAGWWVLYLVTAAQPVFAALDAGSADAGLGRPLGRTAGAAAVMGAMLPLKRELSQPAV